MKDREARAREIQEGIRLVLHRDWDPIGVYNEPAAQDEYDSYVGAVYHLLASGATEQQVADHLWQIEKERMGLPASDSSNLRPVARTLCALDVKL